MPKDAGAENGGTGLMHVSSKLTNFYRESKKQMELKLKGKEELEDYLQQLKAMIQKKINENETLKN